MTFKWPSFSSSLESVCIKASFAKLQAGDNTIPEELVLKYFQFFFLLYGTGFILFPFFNFSYFNFISQKHVSLFSDFSADRKRFKLNLGLPSVICVFCSNPLWIRKTPFYCCLFCICIIWVWIGAPTVSMKNEMLKKRSY